MEQFSVQILLLTENIFQGHHNFLSRDKWCFTLPSSSLLTKITRTPMIIFMVTENRLKIQNILKSEAAKKSQDQNIPREKKNIPFNLWGASCSSSVSSPREKVWIWNIQDKLGYFSIHFTLCLRKVFAKKERWNCHVYDPIELILTPQPDFEPMRLCWKNEPNRSKNVDFTASSLRMEIFFYQGNADTSMFSDQFASN